MNDPEIQEIDDLEADDADMASRYTITVGEGEGGTRLDKYLTDALADKVEALSRARLKALLDEGAVLLDGAPPGNASQKVKEGQVFTITMPPPVDATPLGQAIDLEIIYEDDDLIVVMKPAGLVVHPAPGNPDWTLVNALIAHCGDSLSGIGGERRPGIVHRLDKDTSGVMVVAKNDFTHHGLADQFAAHGRDGRLSRSYTALVWGAPEPRKGLIEGNIARSTKNRLKMAISRNGGREAITHYEVREKFGEPALVSLVECALETGRTHQIRVHMTSIGHPLLGDETYGAGQRNRAVKLTPEAQTALLALNRQALHAHHLGFEHPRTLEPMSFDAEIPADMAHLIEALEAN
ncbi:MAG: RluA family pseudouridine synthase [Rhizobiales bacterium]|nr:RluA family pseudouridine synthase [Hyphomicrobiales bacterium]